MADKTKEYEVLRSEILEYWKIQENLIYASIIVVGAAFLGFDKVIEASQKAPTIPVAWLVFSILHVLVYVIATRLWMNYHRIFRIGAYIRVFHDGLGNSGNSKTDGRWHHVWREIDQDRQKYGIQYNVGAFAPKTDAFTLGAILAIGAIACFFADQGVSSWILIAANVFFGLYTVLRLVQLAMANSDAKVYAEAFKMYFHDLNNGPSE